MDDPIRRHPTRAEQLDIMATLIADHAEPGDQLLDLGCGAGYLGHLVLNRHPELSFVGIDRSGDALEAARLNLADVADRIRLVQGDLEALGDVSLPEKSFRFITTVLAFHDISDAAKRSAIDWAVKRLDANGFFLLYDRVRLDELSLFPLQQSLWQRIERVHGEPMRTADSYQEYRDSFANRAPPASLGDYLGWFNSAGLAAVCLHLHGNTALIAAARRP